MIEIKDLTKSYGKSRGVIDINLDITKGEIFGFVGPNGAGKSTTIKCIMNMINKNFGSIKVDSKEIDNKNYIIKEEIGYLPSEINLYDDLTVEKMIKYSASFYKKDCMKRAEELIKRLDVEKNKKIDELSFGNLKKVGIILALMHEPKILILDEATSGLDPLMQEVFYDILKEEKKKGTTVFFSSHVLSEIKKVCDRVGIIKEGKLIKVDRVDKITNSDTLIITIVSNDIENIKEELSGKIIEEKQDSLKIIYDKDINEFIASISKFKLEKLHIDEPSIEEVFMHYYK